MGTKVRFLVVLLLSFALPSLCLAQVNVELSDLAPGETVTFRYRVKINPSNTLPAGLTSVSTQGIVSSTQFGETLTDDPNISGSSNPTTVQVVIRDSDGDGTADDLDQCPNSALKIAPGSCGCNALDSDVNGNSIFDCLLNEDIQERLSRALTLLKRLKPNSRLKNKKKRKAQNQAKKELRSIRKQINDSVLNSLDAFVLSDPSVNLSALNKGAFRKIKGALRTGSSAFKKNKKQAQKAVRKLQNALA